MQERFLSLHGLMGSIVATALILAGMWFWLSEGTPDAGTTPLLIALISGVLGSTLLLARLVSRQELWVRRELAWISLLLLIATAMFTVEGLYSPDAFDRGSRGPDAVHRAVAHTAFIGGGIIFSIAMGSLVSFVGRLNQTDALPSPRHSEE